MTEIEKAERWYGLQRGHWYKLAYNLDNRELRGKPVSFHGYKHSPSGDVVRAVVRLSDGQEWLVVPHAIIKGK